MIFFRGKFLKAYLISEIILAAPTAYYICVLAIRHGGDFAPGFKDLVLTVLLFFIFSLVPVGLAVRRVLARRRGAILSVPEVPSCAHPSKAMVDIRIYASLESFDRNTRITGYFSRCITSEQEIAMKRIAALFVLIVLCAPLATRAQNSAPAAQPAPAHRGAAQAPQGRKKRVAVFDFDYATVKTNSAALFGTDIDVGKGIADLLVKNLVTDGTYSVIERKALDKILAEQNFSNSDRANPASAAKIGKILGLDAIIVGSITEFGNETKNTKIGGGGGGFGGFGDRRVWP